MTNPISENFCFHTVTETYISRMMRNFPSKTSAGMDELSMKFLKLIQDPLISPITNIVNQTILTSIFPKKLLIARITVYKKAIKITLKIIAHIITTKSLKNI